MGKLRKFRDLLDGCVLPFLLSTSVILLLAMAGWFTFTNSAPLWLAKTLLISMSLLALSLVADLLASSIYVSRRHHEE